MTRDLGDDMRGCAKAVDADPLRVARHGQRAIADESRAQQWRRFHVRISLRQMKAVTAVGDRALGVTAIDRIPRNTRFIAQILATGETVTAVTTGMAYPRHADPFTHAETAYSRPHRRNGADDFMARDHRPLWMGQFAVNQVQVGTANTACVDIDQQLARSGHRIWNLQVPQGTPGIVEYHCPHLTPPLRDGCRWHSHERRSASPCRIPA